MSGDIYCKKAQEGRTSWDYGRVYLVKRLALSKNSTITSTESTIAIPVKVAIITPSRPVALVFKQFTSQI